MRRPLLLGACILAGASVPGILLSCGLDVTGLAASGADASEASMADSGVTDTGAMDTSVADAGTDSNVSDGSDSSMLDSGMPEASCAGLMCNGGCIAATDCRACSGAPLLCASTGQCVSDCQGCKDSKGAAVPIECFVCDSNHQNPIGTCQYDDAGSYCLSGAYQGQYQGGPGYQCTCTDGGIASCPGATQVCVPLGNVGASFCLTCGETTLAPMQGQRCMGGGACQADAAVCQ